MSTINRLYAEIDGERAAREDDGRKLAELRESLEHARACRDAAWARLELIDRGAFLRDAVPVILGDPSYEGYQRGAPSFISSRLLCHADNLPRLERIMRDSATVKPTIVTPADHEWDREWAREAPYPAPPPHERPKIQRHVWTHSGDSYAYDSTLDMFRRLGTLWSDAAWSAVYIHPDDPEREWYIGFAVYQVVPGGSAPKVVINGAAVYREHDGAPMGWSLHT